MKRPQLPAAGSALAEAIALHERGKLNPARKIYREILARQPNNGTVLELLGQLHGEQGEFAESARMLERAVALNPQSLVATFNLGNALKVLKRYGEAEAMFRRAVGMAPDKALVHLNLGEVMIEQRRPADAVPHYREAVRLEPKLGSAHLNLGQAYTFLGRYREASASFEQAMLCEPDKADTYREFGRALLTLGRLKHAADVLKRAAELEPANRNILGLLGNALRTEGRNAEAIGVLQRAFQIEPEAIDVVVDLVTAKRELADWEGIDKLERQAARLASRQPRDLSSPQVLFVKDDPALHQTMARNFSALHDAGVRGPAVVPARPEGSPLRIGYFSADFGDHPVAHAIVGVLEAHDRSKFEIHAFSARPPDGSEVRARIERAVAFCDVSGLEPWAIVEEARKRRLDIAVDLTGHTAGGQQSVFAQRVAPIQVNFLGYPGTLGAPWIDYVVADSYVIPLGSEGLFDERVVRLPGVYLPCDYNNRAPKAAPARSAEGLPDDAVVLASFNSIQKVSEAQFEGWLRIMKAVPGSVLWIAGAGERARANIARAAAARGFGEDRIVFARRVPLREDHLARQQLADLFLDTHPYNAHSTALESLWAGVPVVTVEGRSFPARVCGSLLTALGLGELIAPNSEAYEALATELALNAGRRAALRSRLAEARSTSPVFDAVRFARGFEKALADMAETSMGSGA